MNKGLKTIEDYKSYYEDSTREQILDDTYIDFIGYQNLAKEYSRLQQENKQLKEQLKIKDDGFTASTEELCKYATILEELKKWLEEDKEKAMCTFETGRCFNYYDILDKIKELEGE